MSPLADCEAGNVQLEAFLRYYLFYVLVLRCLEVTKDSITEYQIKVLKLISTVFRSPRRAFPIMFRSSVSSNAFCHLLKSVERRLETRCHTHTDGMNRSIAAGPSGDCAPLKRIKTEPPDGEIIQVTVPGECEHARQPLAFKKNNWKTVEMNIYSSQSNL